MLIGWRIARGPCGHHGDPRGPIWAALHYVLAGRALKRGVIATSVASGSLAS
jgi:hypothetical protein